MYEHGHLVSPIRPLNRWKVERIPEPSASSFMLCEVAMPPAAEHYTTVELPQSQAPAPLNLPQSAPERSAIHPQDRRFGAHNATPWDRHEEWMGDSHCLNTPGWVPLQTGQRITLRANQWHSRFQGGNPTSRSRSSCQVESAPMVCTSDRE